MGMLSESKTIPLRFGDSNVWVENLVGAPYDGGMAYPYYAPLRDQEGNYIYKDTVVQPR